MREERPPFLVQGDFDGEWLGVGNGFGPAAAILGINRRREIGADTGVDVLLLGAAQLHLAGAGDRRVVGGGLQLRADEDKVEVIGAEAAHRNQQRRRQREGHRDAAAVMAPEAKRQGRLAAIIRPERPPRNAVFLSAQAKEPTAPGSGMGAVCK
jgi:hypothetical protein